MSAIVVIVVDGVLCKRDQAMPIAEPDHTGIRLAKALQNQFGAIGYLSTAIPVLVRDWLATYDCPAGIWVHQTTDKPEALAGILGRRGDRVCLFVDSTPDAFPMLSAMRVPLLYFHSEPWAVSDWRQESSWNEPSMPEVDQ